MWCELEIKYTGKENWAGQHTCDTQKNILDFEPTESSAFVSNIHECYKGKRDQNTRSFYKSYGIHLQRKK